MSPPEMPDRSFNQTPTRVLIYSEVLAAETTVTCAFFVMPFADGQSGEMTRVLCQAWQESLSNYSFSTIDALEDELNFYQESTTWTRTPGRDFVKNAVDSFQTYFPLATQTGRLYPKLDAPNTTKA